MHLAPFLDVTRPVRKWLPTKSSKNLSVHKIKTSHHGMCLKQYLKQAGVFYGVKATRPSRVVLDPIKHMRRIFWTASKTFLEKRASNRQLYFCERWKLSYKKNIRQEINMQENQISRVCFELSAFNRTRHDVLFQSFFGRMKMPRRRDATSKSICAVTWMFLWDGRMVGKTKI